MESVLLEKIEACSSKIGVIGLGYVGLPLLLRCAECGFPVIGFDIDPHKVDLLRKGETYIRHIDPERIRRLKEASLLDVTDDFSRLDEPDCILICVPTPLSPNREPDLSYVVNTAKDIAEKLRPGQLVVLESTSYPGTTEELLLPLLGQRGLQVGRDFFLGYSPEREDPGNPVYHFGNIPKIVSGVTGACLKVVSALYGKISGKIVPVSSTRVAEFAKLLENIYRSVNIALVNEMKILAHRMGVNIWEVIEAAATKPFGFTPFYPGPGLGGHCIPVDPFYLSWKAREYGLTARFIELAGEINVSMPRYVFERIVEALNDRGKCLKGSEILILGIAYKRDVDDDRESPAYPIMDMLIKSGAFVLYHDPLIPRLKPTRKYAFSMESVELDEGLLARVDAVLIVTDHSSYDYDWIVRHARLVIDTRNATRSVAEGREKIVMA